MDLWRKKSVRAKQCMQLPAEVLCVNDSGVHPALCPDEDGDKLIHVLLGGRVAKRIVL